MKSGGWFDYDMMTKRLDAITSELALEDNWSDKSKLMSLQKEQKQKQSTLNTLDTIKDDIELIDYTITSLIKDNDIHDNVEMIEEMNVLLVTIGKKLDSLETTQMFKSKEDFNDAYIDIQSGSGGTEAQDWVAMLLRMYLRWLESKNFKHEVVELSEGEVAGYKSATIKVNGDFAYGWLRTETGVHRLVRKSPFDSGSRRHTSFASIFISPEVDETVEIEINPADLRIDTYRASGAGGQHVNKTDSAIRITHLPTGVVSQCQSQRSQHQNKDKAMAQLRAKLYEIEINKLNEEKQSLEESKADIGWGSQIRSYVLDSSRIKDLRTGVETTNCSAVLDGALDNFIEASLKENI